MLRRSSLVALLFAAGCFAEPSLESTATSGGSSSGGTTDESESVTTTPDPGSTGPDGSSSETGSGTDECLAGRIGCPCDDGTCESDAVCIEGFCELAIPVGCGDDQLADPEECDDGNNEPGDGCSPICTLERECFLAHLGGPAETSIVRTYSVLADGTMSDFASTEVPGHNPPLTGAGSELSRATIPCSGQVYVASSTSGVITGLRPGPDGVTITDQVDVPAVRELACDADLGLLFAT